MSVRRVVLLVLVALFLLPQPSSSEPPSSLTAYLNSRARRLTTVSLYVERIRGGEFPGLVEVSGGPGSGYCGPNCRVYQVEDVQLADGSTIKRERLLSLTEVSILAGISPDEAIMGAYSEGLMQVQKMFNQQFGGPDLDSVITDLGDKEKVEKQMPWINPFRLFAAGGVMIGASAELVGEAGEALRTSAALAQAEQEQANAVFDNLEEAGIEEIDGMRAQKYMVAGLNLPMDGGDGQEVFMNGATIWIGTERAPMIAFRIDGTMVADEGSRPFFVEVQNSDFRTPVGCGEMYEPYRRTMSMGGMFPDELMAEMRQAAEQLDDFERQMASMSPEQRLILDKMLGSQMDTLRGLVDKGAFEHVEEIDEILCDPDLKALFSVGYMAAVDVSEEELRQIQRHLVILAYEPGNTDGVLDTMTQVAISQFQAENGLRVTGEPSGRLADVLAAEVAQQA